MKKYYIVYQITNKINEKIYVGVHRTDDINDGYLGSGKLLLLAIKKYGEDNFKRDILFIYDNHIDMYAKEIEIVNEEFVDRPDTYNIRCGGLGGKMNEETKARVSETLTGTKKSDLTKLRMSNSQIGTKHSEETKKKIRESVIKREFRHNEEARQKMSTRAKNRPNNSIGTIWITNDQINRRIKASEIIPNGWRKGRKNKNGFEAQLDELVTTNDLVVGSNPTEASNSSRGCQG